MSQAPRHVYIHVPFCARRCSYCDFAIAVRRKLPVDDFTRALHTELTLRCAPEHGRSHIDTMYLGGGTPSLLGADGIQRVLDTCREFFRWDDDAEVTIEANPDDVTPRAAAAWKSSGVTRVSLGAQSFDAGALRWMHRTHSSAQIDIAIDVIRDAQFASWSFDLIFALPASVGRDWERDLDLALAKSPPHLSLYGLTVEDGTPLGRWTARGDVQPAHEDAYAAEFVAASAKATRAGLEHYEVSNFARAGHRSRHNQSYWSGVPYLGAGPSAHGFDGDTRRWNRPVYADWQRLLDAGEDPIGGEERLTAAQRGLEAVYLGLRTTHGLQIAPHDLRIVQPWLDAAWATYDGERLRLTPAGWLRLDSLAASLTPTSVDTS